MWKMAELQSAPCHLRFDPQWDEDLPPVVGSQEDLERVFLNIFMNAIDAGGENGTVMVQTRFVRAENMVEISITDDGPGIPEDQRGRIFDAFYTTKEKGTGLGLSVCQSIILQHKGKLEVRSQTGWGATFSIKLPVLQDEGIAAHNRRRSPLEGIHP